MQAWLRGTEEGLARHAALFLAEAGSLSAQALPHLLALLQAGPDRSRYRAALALHARGEEQAYRVTAIGRETVESLAALERQHHSDPHIGTVLDWALKEIRHDDPAAVETWCRALAADATPPAWAILGCIRRLTSPVWPTLARYLAEGPPQVQEALLDSLSWLLRGQTLPNEALSQVRDLLRRLARAEVPAVRRAAVEALGCLAAPQEADGQALLPLGAADATEALVRARALARLASRLQGEARASLEQALRTGLAEPTLRLPAAAGLIRLWLADEKGDLEAFDPARLLEWLAKEAGLAPQEVLEALLLAGNDNDGWDNYHERGTRTLRALVVAQAEALFEPLLDHLETALSEEDGWPPRRIALAAVAAVAEALPARFRHRAAPQRLERLLVQATRDAESFSTRRFALSALSHLRRVTPDVAEALLAAIRDVGRVQQNALAAAERFRLAEGEILPALTAALRDESAATAYAAGQVLAALARDPARQMDIVQALAAAVREPSNHRPVYALEDREIKYFGQLDELLYALLVQVAGAAQE